MDKNLEYRLTLQNHFSGTLVKASNETAKLDSNFKKLQYSAGSFQKSAKGIGKDLFGYATGLLAAYGIKNAVTGIVRATADAESFTNAINASSRSEGEGAANIAFLNNEVKRLGISLIAARDGYKTFSGAVIGSSIQGKVANKIFRQVSEASTVLGLSAEQTEGSFLALGQMISKGTVQAEELRGQLAERIPGAFQIGARAMGVSSKKLGEMMKDGLVQADDFLVKFGNELEKTFGDKLENATQSTRSNLNRMSNEWVLLQENIGKSQSGIISGTVNFVRGLTETLNQMYESDNLVDSALNSKGLGFTKLERFNDFLNMNQTGILDNLMSGGKGQTDALARSLLSNYVKPSSRSETDALGSKSGLLQLRSNYSKAFANKEINKLEYERGYALISASLTKVESVLSAFRTPNGLKVTDGSAKKDDKKIGSATEWNIPRQNVYITVGTLGEIRIEKIDVANSKDIVGELGDFKGDWSKELLEVLNDANLIARR